MLYLHENSFDRKGSAMKRTMFIFLIVFLLVAGTVWSAPKVTVASSISLRGTPKYPEGFTHFDYVNPNAPKGGTLVQYTIGTYDNFHRYAQRGISAAGSTGFYDTLMTSSSDEIDVLYGLIAEKIEYPDDFTWIIFHIIILFKLFCSIFLFLNQSD